MELEKIIQEKLNLLIENGSVEALIEKQITSAVSNVLEDLFRSYGDIGKGLKEVLGEKLKISLEDLDIGPWSLMVNNVVERAINGTALEAAKERIQKDVHEVLWIMENKNWKLSEIVTKYLDTLDESDTPEFEIQESSYGYTYIYIGKKKEKSKYDTYSSYGPKKVEDGIMLHMDKENKVFSVSNRGKVLDPRVDKPNHWETFLMNLWANNCIIEIDESEARDVIETREYNDYN